MSDSDSSSSFSDLHSGDGDFDIRKEIHKEDNQGWGFNLSGISLPWKIFIAVATLIVFGAAIFYLYTAFWSTPEAVIPIDNTNKTITNNTVDSDWLSTLFPKSALEVDSFSESIIQQSKSDLGTILTVNASKRTYENTIFALQVIEEKFSEVMSALSLLEMLSPDESIRKSSNEHILKLHGFSLDNFASKKVYHAVKEYLDLEPKETLKPDEEYYLTELKDYYKRAGYALPDEEFANLTEIKKELAKLTLDFDTNIAEDASSISVARAALKGCDESFIDNLHKDGENYVVGVDYPTYREVMAHCEVQETRRELYIKFNQRAYPKNRDVLVNLVNKRLQLAKMLNYSTYADLDLDSEMAKNPVNVANFVNSISEMAKVKAHKDFGVLNGTLPPGVSLTTAGKLFPYDFGYVNSFYKKANFKIDNREIAKYFPFQSTVDGLFGIYQKFLNIDFKLVAPKWSWHPDVSLIEVYDKNTLEKPRGFIYLDLFPRPNKYSHAAHLGVVSAVKAHKGRVATQSVAVVMCNFPKPTADGKTPSLLKHSDVVTFFHEFGHAMHHLLGETVQPAFSGTNVKTDFVEVISQMFEEWMYDEQVLQSISRHYENNQSLPSEMIRNMVQLKDFNVGIDTQSQIIYTATSLGFFNFNWSTDIVENDLNDLSEKLYTTHLDFFEYLKDEFRMVYSFGHLSGYGAKYYSYLWAKVFALDLFSEITKRGMNDPKVGEEFVSKILAKGGSEDPLKLMKDFLGREPNQDAFFKRLN